MNIDQEKCDTDVILIDWQVAAYQCMFDNHALRVERRATVDLGRQLQTEHAFHVFVSKRKH